MSYTISANSYFPVSDNPSHFKLETDGSSSNDAFDITLLCFITPWFKSLLHACNEPENCPQDRI